MEGANCSVNLKWDVVVLAVQMEKVLGIHLAVHLKGGHAGFMKDVSEVLGGPQVSDDII